MTTNTYVMQHTDGTTWFEIEPGTVNNTTNLELPGYGYSGTNSWSQLLDQNFLKLLENFSNETAPNKPTPGQLWFNSDNQNLNVFTANGWKILSGTYVQATVPNSTNIADLWFDTNVNRLAYFNGTTWVYITDNGVPNASNIRVDTTNLQGTAFETCTTLQDFIDVITNFNVAGAVLATNSIGKMNILPIKGDISVSSSAATRDQFIITQNAIYLNLTTSSNSSPSLIDPTLATYFIFSTSTSSSAVQLLAPDEMTRPVTLYNRTANTVNIINTATSSTIFNIPAYCFITFYYDYDINQWIDLDSNIIYSAVPSNVVSVYKNCPASGTVENLTGTVDTLLISNNNTNSINITIRAVYRNGINVSSYTVYTGALAAGATYSCLPFGSEISFSITATGAFSLLYNGTINYGLKFLIANGTPISLNAYKEFISCVGSTYSVAIDGNTLQKPLSFVIPTETTLITASNALVCVVAS